MSRIGSSSSQQIFGPQGTLRSATEGMVHLLEILFVFVHLLTTNSTVMRMISLLGQMKPALNLSFRDRIQLLPSHSFGLETDRIPI
ncbi:hypothetical protein EJB05_45390 [Eragrostis curvula]|uniref:Uncharacterized protein n=1 Tax=Eragrostis curvula TaxID=38414 RepID=A0A5J9TKT2_9POAL|nr:hypothetical protein EJB05_45390 [Eragrostis curvula]